MIKRLLTELRETTSPIKKVNILKRTSSSIFFVEKWYQIKKVLRYTYDPNYKFKITNIVPDEDAFVGEPSEEMFDLLDKLRDSNANGMLRAEVKQFAQEHGNLILLICRKDLRCGISAATINKAIPGLIPTFKVQLAMSDTKASVSYPALAQIKYDGVRLVAMVRIDGSVTFCTRNGKELLIPELEEALSWPNSYDTDWYYSDISSEGWLHVMLDGELCYKEGKSDGRTSVSGLVNSAIRGGELDMKDLNFYVFDILPLDSFLSDETVNVRCEKRTDIVRDIIDNWLVDTRYISSADTWLVHDDEQVENIYAGAIKAGYEGLILKNLDGLYSYKRSKDWVKKKAILTAELTCVLYLKGKPGTKYENDIGKLVCEGYVDGEYVKVNVGSGLTDFDRVSSEDNFVGNTIEVKYNAVIPSHCGKYKTLFLPRFVAVRRDK